MLKYKPSVLAAVFIFLGFELQFEILAKEKKVTLPLKKKEGVNVIDTLLG